VLEYQNEADTVLSASNEDITSVIGFKGIVHAKMMKIVPLSTRPRVVQIHILSFSVEQLSKGPK